MHVLVDDLCLRMLGQLCAWAEIESAWPAVGTVDRRGQQNALFVTLVGRTKGESKHTEAKFCRFWRIHFAYESLRCLNLEMLRFSWWRQTAQQRRRPTKPIALPLAHARGIILSRHHCSLVPSSFPDPTLEGGVWERDEQHWYMVHGHGQASFISWRCQPLDRKWSDKSRITECASRACANEKGKFVNHYLSCIDL